MGFQQGLSGLNAAAKNLEVIGNNVSNANTVGFKQSQAQFADMYANSLSGGGGSAQIGIGTRVVAVAQQFTQGNVTTTNNSLDMAVSGNGFFRMDNNGTISYSRNGQFQLDKSGNIVNSMGEKLTGYAALNGVVVTSAPKPLNIDTNELPPKQTVIVNVGLNLDSRSTVIPAAPTFDLNNSATFNNSTSMTVYDSQGQSHIASLYFAKTAANAWNVHAVVDGNMVPSTGAALTSMTFDPANGSLLTPGVAVTSALFSPTPPPITLAGSLVGAAAVNGASTVTVTTTAGLSIGATVTGGNLPANTTIANINNATTFTTSVLAAGTAGAVGTLTATNPASAVDQTLTFNFATPATATSPAIATTQYGGVFGVNALTQDGNSSGRMTGFSTGADGIISGRYSNGQTRILGRVILASFTNTQGLQPLGGNNWAETSASGIARTGEPGSSNLGVLQTSAVEDSNVDLTAELVNMITAQRVYQANAQTVKTMDQVLQTLVNLR